MLDACKKYNRPTTNPSPKKYLYMHLVSGKVDRGRQLEVNENNNNSLNRFFYTVHILYLKH